MGTTYLVTHAAGHLCCVGGFKYSTVLICSLLLLFRFALPGDEAGYKPSWRHTNSFEPVLRECDAVLNKVGVIDLTPFSKYVSTARNVCEVNVSNSLFNPLKTICACTFFPLIIRYEISGADAAAFLDRMCANTLPAVSHSTWMCCFRFLF